MIVTSYVAPNPGISRQMSNARNRDPLNLIFVFYIRPRVRQAFSTRT